MQGVCKSFGEARVLRDVSCTLSGGGVHCLMGPSGAGKTTLLRVLLGLERPDAGIVQGLDPGSISAMFQEDRLCEMLTAVENVALVLPGRAHRGEVRRLLERILPSDCMARPACHLSGGMRRRVSLARAVAFPSRAIVLDEPFTGLDQATKRTVVAFLLAELRGRTLLVSTHSDEDVRLLGGSKLMLADISCGGHGGPRGPQTNLNGHPASGAEERRAMMDTSKTMKEIVEADPVFGEFLVHKGFPFSLENPVVELVTFDDVVELRQLDRAAFLEEYEAYRLETPAAPDQGTPRKSDSCEDAVEKKE